MNINTSILFSGWSLIPSSMMDRATSSTPFPLMTCPSTALRTKLLVHWVTVLCVCC